MAKRPMKTPGAPGAAMKTTANRSFGRTTQTVPLRVDDLSAKDVKAGSLRPRQGKSDAPDNAGTAVSRGRTATNASAQFRITVSHKAPQPEQYPGTLAGGRILPSVMGQKQGFAQGTAS